MTSLSIIVIVGMAFLIIRLLKTKNIAFKIAIVISLIAIPLLIFFYVKGVIVNATTAPDIDFEKLDKVTAQGNLYWHDTVTRGIEDGRYVGLFICDTELEQGWNKRSAKDYLGETNSGHEIKETLIRYLTSKDLRKDANAVAEWQLR